MRSEYRSRLGLGRGGKGGFWELYVFPYTQAQKLSDKKKGKKKKRSATECWVELMTPSPGLKYTNAGASQKRRREREQQIKSCSAPWFLYFTLTASPSLLSVCHICVCCFPDCLLFFFSLNLQIIKFLCSASHLIHSFDTQPKLPLHMCVGRYACAPLVWLTLIKH